MGTAKNDDRRVLTIEGQVLRIVLRNMAKNRAKLAARPVHVTGDVRDAQGRSRSDEIDEGKFLHEIVQEFAVVH